MKQFIIANGNALATNLNYNTYSKGQLAVASLVDGVMTLTGDTGFDKKGYILIGEGKNIVRNVAINLNDLTYNNREYVASSAYNATVTIPAPSANGNYTLIVAKKGVSFNERSNYTSLVYSKATDTAAVLAAKLVKDINSKTSVSGVSATLSGATITITGSTLGVDYEVLGGDVLEGISVTQTHAVEGNGSAEHVLMLANADVADKGINYTYDMLRELYPTYPTTEGETSASTLTYTIHNISFREPSYVKTVDTEIRQTIQIAVPTASTANAALETMFTAMVGA